MAQFKRYRTYQYFSGTAWAICTRFAASKLTLALPNGGLSLTIGCVLTVKDQKKRQTLVIGLECIHPPPALPSWFEISSWLCSFHLVFTTLHHYKDLKTCREKIWRPAKRRFEDLPKKSEELQTPWQWTLAFLGFWWWKWMLPPFNGGRDESWKLLL